MKRINCLDSTGPRWKFKWNTAMSTCNIISNRPIYMQFILETCFLKRMRSFYHWPFIFTVLLWNALDRIFKSLTLFRVYLICICSISHRIINFNTSERRFREFCLLDLKIKTMPLWYWCWSSQCCTHIKSFSVQYWLRL